MEKKTLIFKQLSVMLMCYTAIPLNPNKTFKRNKNKKLRLLYLQITEIKQNINKQRHNGASHPSQNTTSIAVRASRQRKREDRRSKKQKHNK